MNKKGFFIIIILFVLNTISVLNFKTYGQDFDRPVASALTLSPTFVDVSSGGVTVTLSIRVSDTSGVSLVNNSRGGYLYPSDNILNGDKNFSPWSLVNGNQFDGIYEATLFVNPSNVPSATYNVAESDYAFRDPGGLTANDQSNLSLQVRNSYNTVYFENGICKCPGTTVGDTETINGVTYTVVDNSTIQGQINSGNVNLCTSLVTNMSGLFRNSTSFNSNIEFWDTSNVTNMNEMFDGATAFNQDIGNWDLSNVINMRYMFNRASAFNQDISSWDVSSVTNMEFLFREAVSFNIDIGVWNTENVENMNQMFYEADSFNQNIGVWDVSSVASMENMFRAADVFNQDIGSWDVSNVTAMDYMLNGAVNFNQDLTGWCVSNITSEPNDFSTNSALTNENKPVWGTCPTCSITSSVTTGALTQTVTQSTAIVTTTIDFTTTCTGTLGITTSGLPPGILSSISSNSITLYGFPSNQASGTYNYSITASNTSGNSSATSTGTFTVLSSQASIYFENETCKCPNATVGETATISGTTYTVVDNSTIQGEVDNDNVNLCTTLVTNMVELFRDKTSFNSEIGFWDTSNVTNMTSIFRNAESFNQEINSWDVSNVVDMTDMFGHAINFNKDISSWDISNVTLMTYMFRGAENFNQDIGGWNVSNVTSMFYTFTGAENFNKDISGWDTSNVTDMYNLFHNAFDFNQDIGNWDVSSVTDMTGMFKGASSFNQDLNSWNVSNVTSMNNMFKGASSFDQDLNDWDVSSVENISGMFWDASSFNGEISNWNTSSVINMSLLFEGATQFNQPIGSWDTSSVQSFQSVFFGASSFNQDIGGWNTGSSIDMAAMFNSAQSFNRDIGGWDVSNVNQMFNMFIGATSFNQDLSGWCVSNITSEPNDFSTNSALTNENKPVWGTCPTCSITSSVTTGALTQTVTQTTAIVTITIDFTTTCTGTLGISASGLPQGVLTSISSNSITLYGFPSNQASGSYNYSVTASNTSGTSSDTVTGTLIIPINNDLSPPEITYFSINRESVTNADQVSVTIEFDEPMTVSPTLELRYITTVQATLTMPEGEVFQPAEYRNETVYPTYTNGSTNWIYNWNFSSSYFGAGAGNATLSTKEITITASGTDLSGNLFQGNVASDTVSLTTLDYTNDAISCSISKTIISGNLDQQLSPGQPIVPIVVRFDSSCVTLSSELLYAGEGPGQNPGADNLPPGISMFATDYENGVITLTISGTLSNQASGSYPFGFGYNNSYELPATSNYPSPRTTATSSQSIIGSLTVVPDNTNPTVTLSDSDTDNFVRNGDTIVVTATFSEAMLATPTISIQNVAINSQVSDTAMSATSSAAIWFYNWTVSSTISTQVRVTVAGSDLSENQYAGSDELRFSILPTNILGQITNNGLPYSTAMNGETSSPCQVSESSSDTLFSVTLTTSNSLDDYNKQWLILNPQSGVGALVSTPGSLDPVTGNMDWNTGWWGSFGIEVSLVNTSTGNILDTASKTIIIGQQNGPITSVTHVTPLPECPIPSSGYTVMLTTGGQPVNWYIDNPNALTTNTAFLHTNTVYELNPGQDDSTLSLDFRPGFYGDIIITAEPTPCAGERVDYLLSVPPPPIIDLVSGINTDNQQLCSGTAMNTITYEITGAADRVLAHDLPPGVTPLLEITSQLTTITLNTVTGTTIGRTYSISIDSQRYDFVTTVATTTANAAAHIGNGLVAAVNAGTNDFDATFTDGAIVIEVGPSGQPGESFIVYTTSPENPAVTFAAPIASPLTKTFSLFGTPTGTASLYNYQIETEAPQPSCSIGVATGTITILDFQEAGTIIGSQTIGSGSFPAQLTGTIPAGVSTPTYQWQSGTDSATFDDIAGATQQNYSPTALTTTTFFRRKVTNAGGCEAFSNVVKVEVDTVGPSIIAVEMTDNTTVTIQFNEPVFANANQSTITTAKFRFTTQTGSITVNSPTPSSIAFDVENKINLGVDITGSTNGTQTLVINILGLLYDAVGNSLPINQIIQTVAFDLDDDLDGVLNKYDECPATPFGQQADQLGCANSQRDDDEDGVNNGIDECPDTNEGEEVDEFGCALYQLDEDLDGVLNDMDECPDTPSDETANAQGCSPSQIDTDEDGIPDFLDNCPETANPEQTDADGDGKGDVCDPDPAIAVIIFELGEDAEPGTYVGEINAVDKDGLPVDVTIDSPEELFVLESTSIILNGELDYETAIEHEIQVFAVSERGSSNTFVTIPVSDVPNATYTGNFTITVFDVQNEQLGSKVDYTRYFNDNDKGVGKWKIKKKITGGNDAGLFRIEEISFATDKIEDENTGILAFINPPDFENPQDHNQDNIYEVEVTYINTEDGELEVPIPTTQFNLTVPENATDAIELQSYPALPTDDTDGDGVPDVQDNSPVNYNPDQTDTDGDGVGDASDDADHDGVWDPYDTCPDTPLGERVDLDGCIQFYLPPTNFSISKTEKCRNTNSIGITAVAQEYTYNVAVSGATTLNDSFAGATDYTIQNLSGGVYTVCLTVEGYDASEYQRCFEVLIEEPEPLSVYASKTADSETVNFSLKGGQVYNITHNGKTVQTDQSNYAVKLDKGNNVINISTGIECQGIFEQTYFNSASIVLAPNPIKEMLYVYVGGEDTDVVISIYASNGVVVHTARYSLDASRTVPLEVGQLQQGSYVVKAQGNTINTSELLIKE